MARSKRALQRNEERLVELVAGWTDTEQTPVIRWPEPNDLIRTGLEAELTVPGRIVHLEPECVGNPQRWGLAELWRDAGRVLYQQWDRRYVLMWDVDHRSPLHLRAFSDRECAQIERLLEPAPSVRFPDAATCGPEAVIEYLCREQATGWNPVLVSELGIGLYLSRPGTWEIPVWVYTDYRDRLATETVWVQPDDWSIVVQKPGGLPFRLFWLAQTHTGAYARQLTAVESQLLRDGFLAPMRN